MNKQGIKKEVTIGDCRLILGDCLEVMPLLGKVDMVLVDPPYGTTACKWDSIIPLEQMWAQLKEITKPTAAIVMTASQPFTTKLIASNYDMFKYCWVWKKSKAGNFVHARNMPLKQHEDICVFSAGSVKHEGQDNRIPYNPQGVKAVNEEWTRPNKYESAHNYKRPSHSLNRIVTQAGYPSSVIEIGSEHNPPHPTQKPVALMEYLINTYTNAGDTVLDFTMGSGTTLVACAKMGRKGIGIEQDEDYFNIACKRVQEAYNSPDMFIEAAKKPEQDKLDI